MPVSQQADAFAGAVAKAKKTRANNAPRTQGKASFMGLLLSDPRLSLDDKKAIRQVHDAGLTVGDLGAVVAYQQALIQRFFGSGELAAKDVVVAYGKLISSLATAAQLAATSATVNPSKIEITFGGDAVSNGRQTMPNDAVIGDIVTVH